VGMVHYVSSRREGLLLADGKNFVWHRSATRTTQVWDVSRDPNRFEPETDGRNRRPVTVRRDGQWLRTLTTPDGRLSLEWPGHDPKEDEPAPGGFPRLAPHTGPFVLRDG